MGASAEERLISDYGLIGDTRTAALVSSAGAIDWLCLPRFDGVPVFARLIGGPEGGTFRLGPAEPYELVRRRYPPRPHDPGDDMAHRRVGARRRRRHGVGDPRSDPALDRACPPGGSTRPPRTRRSPARPRPRPGGAPALVTTGWCAGGVMGRSRPRAVRRRRRDRPSRTHPHRGRTRPPADPHPHPRLPPAPDLRPSGCRRAGGAGLRALVAGMDGQGRLRRTQSRPGHPEPGHPQAVDLLALGGAGRRPDVVASREAGGRVELGLPLRLAP